MKVGQSSLGQMAQGQALGWPAGQPVVPSPMHVLLFGKRPPRLVDRRKYPKLKKALKKLELTLEQIAEILGVSDEKFSLALAEGANASISSEGQIAFGVELLEAHQEDDELLVAILAHEMGHQPWTWPKVDLAHVAKKERERLAREEEAKADRVAGRILAELGLSPERVCEFLLEHGQFERKSLEYDPPEVRAKTVRSAHQRRSSALKRAEKDHPHLARRARQLR